MNPMFGTVDVWDKSTSFSSDNFKIFRKYTRTTYRKLSSQTRDFYYLVFYVPKATVKALNPDKPLHQLLTEFSKWPRIQPSEFAKLIFSWKQLCSITTIEHDRNIEIFST